MPDVVHDCCGCSCYVCAGGHDASEDKVHTVECMARFEARHRHHYVLIGLSGRERFQAGCTCGWKSKDIYPAAGMASSAHTTHVEGLSDDNA